MVSPDSSTPASGGTSALRKIKIPLALLAIEGTSPAQGDDVAFTVSGRLGSVSGEEGEVEITAINDEPLAAAKPEPTEDEAALNAAAEADAKSYTT